MDLVRTYGGELAALVVTGRRAQVDATGSTTGLDVGEEIGHRGVVNRAVAGLPSQVGLVAVTSAGVEWLTGALELLRDLAARQPRAGLLAPQPSGSAGPPDGPAGAFPFLLRRAAWDSVDGYDTRITDPRLADLDLRARLRRAGWLVVAGPPVGRRAGTEGVDGPFGRQGMLGG